MFVYIQSLLIMMLEILCCKIFFEAFGIKREENNCWKNYSIVIGLTVLCYFIAMIFRDYFIVKQVFSIILITFFMLLYLKLSFGKAMILSALFESLLLVMDYFALLMNIYIFHNMEEVWESHVIQGSLVVVLGKALLLFAVLIIRNHMEKKSLAMLADTEWLRFIFFPIFTICVITAMIKMSEDIKNKAQENLFFVIACGLAGMNIVVFYLIYDILKRENKLQEERIYRIQVKNQIGMYRSISENFDKQKKMTHELSSAPVPSPSSWAATTPSASPWAGLWRSTAKRSASSSSTPTWTGPATWVPWSRATAAPCAACLRWTTSVKWCRSVCAAWAAARRATMTTPGPMAAS